MNILRARGDMDGDRIVSRVSAGRIGGWAVGRRATDSDVDRVVVVKLERRRRGGEQDRRDATIGALGYLGEVVTRRNGPDGEEKPVGANIRRTIKV